MEEGGRIGEWVYVVEGVDLSISLGSLRGLMRVWVGEGRRGLEVWLGLVGVGWLGMGVGEEEEEAEKRVRRMWLNAVGVVGVVVLLLLPKNVGGLWKGVRERSVMCRDVSTLDESESSIGFSALCNVCYES